MTSRATKSFRQARFRVPSGRDKNIVRTVTRCSFGLALMGPFHVPSSSMRNMANVKLKKIRNGSSWILLCSSLSFMQFYTEKPNQDRKASSWKCRGSLGDTYSPPNTQVQKAFLLVLAPWNMLIRGDRHRRKGWRIGRSDRRDRLSLVTTST